MALFDLTALVAPVFWALTALLLVTLSAIIAGHR
jgi:hypothetical protein